ncbi:MAG: four helix bundle protein [Candidatus Staskawiczbacteria bacterium]|nr:four helix bundle protein [Candidatus Staskawiczbacteria bacterium]
MPQLENKYDLEERTGKFSSNLIIFCKACPKDAITLPLINQLIRSGTSVGANYREANGASSKRDFQNKIFICKKEAKEKARELWQETKEFVLIFGKIAYSTQK